MYISCIYTHVIWYVFIGRCLRMDTHTFDWLVGLVTPLIGKQDTHLRLSITPGERLSLTLRHLSTG